MKPPAVDSPKGPHVIGHYDASTRTYSKWVTYKHRYHSQKAYGVDMKVFEAFPDCAHLVLENRSDRQIYSTTVAKLKANLITWDFGWGVQWGMHEGLWNKAPIAPLGDMTVRMKRPEFDDARLAADIIGNVGCFFCDAPPGAQCVKKLAPSRKHPLGHHETMGALTHQIRKDAFFKTNSIENYRSKP